MAEDRWWNRRQQARRCLVVAITGASALLPATAQAAPSAAAGGGGCQAVHAGPQLAANGSQESYFQLTLRPGERQREAVLVANPEAHPCAVTLEAAYGQTAINSGDTYSVAEKECVETSCWLAGLPTTVTVPAGGRLAVNFDVAVPPGASGGQYLAGVVARPADPPSASSASGRDGQVAVAVATRVAIGVAVTVPGPLRPQLEIPSVTLDLDGGTPQLRVRVRNSGNTWEHPAGGARVQVESTTRSFGVRSSTILAGDVAELPLPIEGVQRGRWHTRVLLNYGHDQTTVWEGDLNYPTPRQPSAAPGGSSDIAGVAASLPAWVIASLATLACVVIVLLVLLIAMFRRRRATPRRGRHRPATATDPTGDAESDARCPVGSFR
jgi:hypothetical protein